MRVGTKSLLFGYHQLLLHPLFVWAAWISLYGWTWDPRIIAAFFLHDVGYFGKPNMDGLEGIQHPFAGAKILHWLFDAPNGARWYFFSLYHSRVMAKTYFQEPSDLCWADKKAFLMYPVWLLRVLFFFSGEDKEYRMNKYENGTRIQQEKMLPFAEWHKSAADGNKIPHNKRKK